MLGKPVALQKDFPKVIFVKENSAFKIHWCIKIQFLHSVSEVHGHRKGSVPGRCFIS